MMENASDRKLGRDLVASFPGSAQLSVRMQGEPENEARGLEWSIKATLHSDFSCSTLSTSL